ncbi:MAG: H-NS histone family protein [Bacteriophage sp.]|nr:MAG: H-NS histone family protein [Bacteriophage sp.]
MSTYKQLLAQREELEAQIKAAESVEKQAAISQARQLVSDFGLTVEDLFIQRKEVKKAAIKYRDTSTGAEWSGRGREPLWIKGKSREQFAV